VPDRLAPIVERKRAEVRALHCGRVAMWARAEGMAPAREFLAGLRGGAVIAEMKRRSPSGGVLRSDLDPTRLGARYQAAGAAALSVLTDGPDFGGSLTDLAAVTTSAGIPVLRKDFIVDPVQIAETRIAGADVVLLIAALIGDRGRIEEMLGAAARAGLSAIVEVHTAAETRFAAEAGAACIGINTRDLRTLRTDLATFARLRRLVPSGIPCIAESGIRDVADVRRLRSEGADAVLAGESLMRSPDPALRCAEYVAAMRA
jgi:indole-3-glycerol phosphate synthase